MSDESKSTVINFVPIDEVNTELRVADYALDRLSQEERIEFENELKNSEILRDQLDEEIRFIQQLQNSKSNVQSLSTSQDKNFDKFSVLLDNNDSENPALSPVSTQNNKRYLRMISGTIAASFVIAAMFIIVPNEPLETSKKGEFVTLSNNSQQLIDNSKNQFYSLVFEPNLSKDEREKLIDGLNLEFVAGPSEGQTYLLRIKEQLEPTEVEKIQSLEQVIFFEPAVFGNGHEAK